MFSLDDAYARNYQRIAADHIAAMKPGADNPFIENELWETLEASTRALILAHVPSGARVLDVGVGLGRLLGDLNQYDRHGIDISFDYLKRARLTGIDVAFARAEELPHVDDSFDAVVTCDVLEHVLDLNECCAQMVRVLRPGGALIVRVPFREDLSPYVDEGVRYEYIHLRAFDEAGLRLLFTKVFRLAFIEARTVAPYLQGAPRLKVQLLPDAQRQRLAEVVNTLGVAAPLLDHVTSVSSEELVTWLYELRSQRPDHFRAVLDHLVHPIEINAVFRKPSSAP